MKSPFLLAFVAILTFTFCQKKVEGCLDAEAQNFKVDADRSCDSCCVFPKLQLDFAFRSPFDSLRKDARGVPFQLRALTFYLSEIELLRPDGSIFRVQDSLRLRLFPDSSGLVLRRDFALFKNSLKNYEVGSVVAKGEFEGLRFSVGLDDLTNRAIPKMAPANSPLGLQTEKMWSSPDSNFLFFKLLLKKDTSAAAETAFVFEKSAGRVLVNLPFSSRTFKKGKAAAMTVFLDLNKLVAGADFSKTDAENLAVFRGNLGGVFEVK